MQYDAMPCNTMQYYAMPCNAMQYHAIPCNTMQYNAIPCNTMQYHASLIAAGGAYHCPVGSKRPFFLVLRDPDQSWKSWDFVSSRRIRGWAIPKLAQLAQLPPRFWSKPKNLSNSFQRRPVLTNLLRKALSKSWHCQKGKGGWGSDTCRDFWVDWIVERHREGIMIIKYCRSFSRCIIKFIRWLDLRSASLWCQDFN